jgi:5-methylcytosine-specific restriction enzyme B
VDLGGHFRPGQLLEWAKRAQTDGDRYHICIMDEMNLARVEHYFAEVLSKIEDRHGTPSAGFRSTALLDKHLPESASEWKNVCLPSNFAIVGTVNMDESAHGFSRKVLDRAFTIELSDVDLRSWGENARTMTVDTWPVSAWLPRGIQLGGIDSLTDDDRDVANDVVQTLTEVNRFLVHAQLQVGYRTRDEMALFALHAGEIAPAFATASGNAVDPIDLALQMKILPRISGGSSPVRRTLLQLLGWAYDEKPLEEEGDATRILEKWESADRGGALEGAKYPRTASRLCLMWDRLLNEGFTSFWL